MIYKIDYNIRRNKYIIIEEEKKLFFLLSHDINVIHIPIYYKYFNNSNNKIPMSFSIKVNNILN